MRRWWYPALAALTATAQPVGAGMLAVGKPMPDIELTLVDGQKVRLADLKGEVIVLNYWATWCVPCRKELPLLDAYHRKLRDKGLRVFAITTESSLPLSQLKPLFAKMTIPSVRRVKGVSNEVRALPTNFVIDRAGIVRHTKSGAFDLDELNAKLIPLLNERPAG